MNQFFGFATKDRNALSASSAEAILNCPAQFFFESALDTGFKFPKHPASVYGQAQHYINEQLINRMWKNGPLPLSDKERTVAQWTGFLWAVFLGTEVLPSRTPESIQWLSADEMLLPESKQQKIVSDRMGMYVRRGEAATEAMYYLCTKQATAVEIITEKRFDTTIESTITPGQQIKVMGYMDLVSRYPSGRVTVIDWKTGRRSAFTLQKILQHTQMLLYSYAIKEEFGVVPDTFIVSQDVSMKQVREMAEDLDKVQNLLMTDPYLIRIPMINYELQVPELIELFSEVWYVLSNLINPPQSLMAMQEVSLWTPKTTIGKLVNLEENLRQSRPIPLISPACDYCNAKAMCKQFNAADWEDYHEKQARARPASIIPRPVGSRTAIIAQSVPSVPEGANLTLFPEAPTQLLTKRWRKAADKINWIKLGFIKVKASSEKLVKQVWEYIPRHWSGAICPCVEGKWVWSELLNHADELQTEKDKHKQVQMGSRQRDAKGKLVPLKPLRRSQVINELITMCPVGNCPHSNRSQTH